MDYKKRDFLHIKDFKKFLKNIILQSSKIMKNLILAFTNLTKSGQLLCHQKINKVSQKNKFWCFKI